MIGVRDREERYLREGSSPEEVTRLVEPLRGKVAWGYALVSRQLRDDDTRRDLRRLTLMIRRFAARVPEAPGAG